MLGPRDAGGHPPADPEQPPIKKSHLLFRPRPLFGGSGFDTILTPRGQLLKQRMSPLVVMAAVAVIPLLVTEEQFTGPTAVFWLHVADWAIWGVFAVELAVMLAVTPNRRAYLRCAWLDVCIVVFTVPLLPYLVASLRLARLGRVVLVLRLLRLLRLAAVVNRAGALIQRVFGTSGLGWLLSGLIVLVVVSGTLFSYLEPGYNVPEGVWWAIVTATTVGYGDVVPNSGLGRLVATLLMIAGISFIALLSAATAARLVELETEEGHEELLAGIRGQSNRDQEVRAELQAVNERLARMEELLAAAAEGKPLPESPPTGPSPDRRDR
ncbi:MAG: potassium channel family protein [Acidimicrobiia bacterium]|nr:potassium channel family protein [Acidimicrobiia bacterium]